jgi:thiol-disulfide isomerase/thioredoxin
MKTAILFLAVCLYAACKSPKDAGEPLPSFDILLADSSTHVNTAQVEAGRPIVLMYFSPDCEHCQKETKDILQHMNALHEARFLFVTIDAFDRLQVFNKYYQLSKYPNVMLGRDEQFFLLRHFRGIAPPYLVLYDRNKKQRASYQGDIAVDSLISVVNNL